MTGDDSRRQEAELAQYRDAERAPRLRQAVVLFLDQLGTQQLVEEDPAGHLARTVEAVALARQLGDLSDDYQVARWFSDNLLLAVRLPDEEEIYDGPALFERAFGLLVINAAWLQLALIVKGLPSRGGIDVGEFYADEDFFYGPALNRAYVLESKKAIWPRVVLSDRALTRVRGESATGDIGTYQAMLVLDEDGAVFVNYLGDLPFTYEEMEQTIGPLKDHSSLIRRGLDTYRADDKLRQKYEWMAAFHDWTVANRLPPEIGRDLTIGCSALRSFKSLDYELLDLPRPSEEGLSADGGV